MVNGMHFRHLAVTANMAATLDIISGGRFHLGLGAGWFEPEAEPFGIALGTIAERLDRFEEGIEIIDSGLRNEFTTFSGVFYELAAARCEPKPVRSPRPPIVIGGKAKKRTLKVIAKFRVMWDLTFTDSPAHWKLNARPVQSRHVRRPRQGPRQYCLTLRAKAGPADRRRIPLHVPFIVDVSAWSGCDCWSLRMIRRSDRYWSAA